MIVKTHVTISGEGVRILLGKTITINGYEDDLLEAERQAAIEHGRALQKAREIMKRGYYERFTNGKLAKVDVTNCTINRSLPSLEEE